MSRSYRQPFFKDSYGTKHKQWAKKQANRAVRRAKDVPDGKAYRRFYNPWDIVDHWAMWDPHPRYQTNWRTREIEVIDPIPEWKARMK